MLKFQSFEITESDKINEFLEKNILANNSTVFHSVGKILIPYEDGELPNKDQQRLMLKELKNIDLKQIELLEHSQTVMEKQVAGINAKLDKCVLVTAPKSKEDYDRNKEMESEIKKLNNILDQHRTTMVQNAVEYTRLMTNIEVFDERIAALE
jgi:hypothetical protein